MRAPNVRTAELVNTNGTPFTSVQVPPLEKLHCHVNVMEDPSGSRDDVALRTSCCVTDDVNKLAPPLMIAMRALWGTVMVMLAELFKSESLEYLYSVKDK